MSTAKSLANSYLNNKRNFNTNLNHGRNGSNTTSTLNSHRFKSSASNLATSNNHHHTTTITQQQLITPQQTRRLKSISMSNLTADEQGSSSSNNNSGSNNNFPSPVASRIQRPASRNALDSIHNGMNAKYAQVQSKVLLQNIRPQASANNNNNTSSKIPATSNNAAANSSNNNSTKTRIRSSTPAGASQQPQYVKVPNDKSALMIKLKALEEELERQQTERENLRQELEREKGDKAEQMQQMKQELQEKLVEHDKQNEEYHQKLLEAYELADQNRRAADTVLSESRQRDEESRKKVEELEAQLVELKEFVSMKEEMTGKMYELREQIREERQRYEEQLKSLHQVFENEKIRSSQLTNSSELMSVSSGSKMMVSIDHNSNYFNRVKPTLESNESINKLTDKDLQQQQQQQQLTSSQPNGECKKCCRDSTGSVSDIHDHQHHKHHKHHASQQDMYGSKLSTRIQSSAKNAWRSSKKLASSVITGGVGLSACRQCRGGKRSKSKSTSSSSNIPTGGELLNVRSNLNPAKAANMQQQHSVSPTTLNALSSNEELDMDANNHQHHNHQHQHHPSQNSDAEHTSVIEVKSSGSERDQLHQQQLHLNQHPNQQQQQQQQQVVCKDASEPTSCSLINEQATTGLIRVDENNKLTIVTKFNDLPAPESSLSPSGASTNNSSVVSAEHQTAPASASSERSRCESSSSGRGTSSSEAGSTAASQNGDIVDEHNNNSNNISISNSNSVTEQASLDQANGIGGKGDDCTEKSTEKRHRRKSSLFKASKVFGGSQVSLNKLKTFFSPGAQVMTINNNINQTNLHQSKIPIQNAELASEQLENSRIRCMELNKAINGPTTTTPTTTTTTTAATATTSIEIDSMSFSQGSKCVEKVGGVCKVATDGSSERQVGQGGALNLAGANEAKQQQEPVPLQQQQQQQQVAALGS